MKNKISTKTIAFLEDRYCRALLEGDDFLYNYVNKEEIALFSTENILKYVEMLIKVIDTVRRLSANV